MKSNTDTTTVVAGIYAAIREGLMILLSFTTKGLSGPPETNYGFFALPVGQTFTLQGNDEPVVKNINGYECFALKTSDLFPLQTGQADGLATTEIQIAILITAFEKALTDETVRLERKAYSIEQLHILRVNYTWADLPAPIAYERSVGDKEEYLKKKQRFDDALAAYGLTIEDCVYYKEHISELEGDKMVTIATAPDLLDLVLNLQEEKELANLEAYIQLCGEGCKPIAPGANKLRRYYELLEKQKNHPMRLIETDEFLGKTDTLHGYESFVMHLSHIKHVPMNVKGIASDIPLCSRLFSQAMGLWLYNGRHMVIKKSELLETTSYAYTQLTLTFGGGAEVPYGLTMEELQGTIEKSLTRIGVTIED